MLVYPVKFGTAKIRYFVVLSRCFWDYTDWLFDCTDFFGWKVVVNNRKSQEEKASLAFLDSMKLDYFRDNDSIALSEAQQKEIPNATGNTKPVRPKPFQ